MTTTPGSVISSPGGFRPRRIRRRITTSDGASLAVSEWPARGAADRTVVFLHGLCLSEASWGIQRRHLLRRFGSHTRAISYDHRGHGDSGSAPTSTYRIDRLAEDLGDVLKTLHVSGPVVLVGHSMGAMTALQFTAGDPTVEVAGLVLCATAAGGLASHGAGRLLEVPAIRAALEAATHIPEWASGAVTAPLRLALGGLRERGGTPTGALAQVIADALETTPLSTAVGYLVSLRHFDITHALADIAVPTTVLSGGMDVLTPPALSRRIVDAIPGATHIHLPHAGHMLPQLERRVVNSAIASMVTAAGPMRRGIGPLEDAS
jgi:pimeloyl-ACP methyl ester carboxylesterase